MLPADKASVFKWFVDTDASRAALLRRVPSSCYVATIQRHKEHSQMWKIAVDVIYADP
jgi:hypothetical protein